MRTLLSRLIALALIPCLANSAELRSCLTAGQVRAPELQAIQSATFVSQALAAQPVFSQQEILPRDPGITETRRAAGFIRHSVPGFLFGLVRWKPSLAQWVMTHLGAPVEMKYFRQVVDLTFQIIQTMQSENNKAIQASHLATYRTIPEWEAEMNERLQQSLQQSEAYKEFIEDHGQDLLVHGKWMPDRAEAHLPTLRDIYMQVALSIGNKFDREYRIRGRSLAEARATADGAGLGTYRDLMRQSMDSAPLRPSISMPPKALPHFHNTLIRHRIFIGLGLLVLIKIAGAIAEFNFQSVLLAFLGLLLLLTLITVAMPAWIGRLVDLDMQRFMDRFDQLTEDSARHYLVQTSFDRGVQSGIHVLHLFQMQEAIGRRLDEPRRANADSMEVMTLESLEGLAHRGLLLAERDKPENQFSNYLLYLVSMRDFIEKLNGTTALSGLDGMVQQGLKLAEWEDTNVRTDVLRGHFVAMREYAGSCLMNLKELEKQPDDIIALRNLERLVQDELRLRNQTSARLDNLRLPFVVLGLWTKLKLAHSLNPFSLLGRGPLSPRGKRFKTAVQRLSIRWSRVPLPQPAEYSVQWQLTKLARNESLPYEATSIWAQRFMRAYGPLALTQAISWVSDWISSAQELLFMPPERLQRIWIQLRHVQDHETRAPWPAPSDIMTIRQQLLDQWGETPWVRAQVKKIHPEGGFWKVEVLTPPAPMPAAPDGPRRLRAPVRFLIQTQDGRTWKGSLKNEDAGATITFRPIKGVKAAAELPAWKKKFQWSWPLARAVAIGVAGLFLLTQGVGTGILFFTALGLASYIVAARMYMSRKEPQEPFSLLTGTIGSLGMMGLTLALFGQTHNASIAAPALSLLMVAALAAFILDYWRDDIRAMLAGRFISVSPVAALLVISHIVELLVFVTFFHPLDSAAALLAFMLTFPFTLRALSGPLLLKKNWPFLPGYTVWSMIFMFVSPLDSGWLPWINVWVPLVVWIAGSAKDILLSQSIYWQRVFAPVRLNGSGISRWSWNKTGPWRRIILKAGVLTGAFGWEISGPYGFPVTSLIVFEGTYRITLALLRRWEVWGNAYPRLRKRVGEWLHGPTWLLRMALIANIWKSHVEWHHGPTWHFQTVQIAEVLKFHTGWLAVLTYTAQFIWVIALVAEVMAADMGWSFPRIPSALSARLSGLRGRLSRGTA